MSNTIKRQINKQTTIHLKPVNEDVDPQSSFYAINWFDVKFSLLYNLYNKLVASRLFAVGGALHFKGRHKKRIIGEDQDKRDMLLIVYYPDVESFLSLISNKFFQLSSLLRVVSVKRFNLAFTERLDSSSKVVSGNYDARVYLVHTFRVSDWPDGLADKCSDLAKKYDLKVYYLGKKAITLTGEKNDDFTHIPFIMDGIILYEGAKAGQFDNLLADMNYLKIIEGFKSNYIAEFDRIN